MCKCNHLRLHYLVVTFLYAFAFLTAYKILSLQEAQKDLVTLLSSGAILATFGSAINNEIDIYSDIDMIICSNDLALSASR